MLAIVSFPFSATFSLALEAGRSDPRTAFIGKLCCVNQLASPPQECSAITRQIAANGIGQKPFSAMCSQAHSHPRFGTAAWTAPSCIVKRRGMAFNFYYAGVPHPVIALAN